MYNRYGVVDLVVYADVLVFLNLIVNYFLLLSVSKGEAGVFVCLNVLALVDGGEFHTQLQRRALQAFHQ